MKKYKQEEEESKNILNEDELIYGHSEAKEEARLREAINRTDEEKFFLFTRMFRINKMLKSAKITHQPVE